MTEAVHIQGLLAPWLTKETFPRCQGKLKTGEPCLASAHKKVGRRWLCRSCINQKKRL